MHLIQQKLLKLVDTYNLGSMPLRDIAQIINIDHPQTVKHHLEQLEKKGLVEWDRENKVIIKSTNSVFTNSDFVIVPVLGAANCGMATIYAEQMVEDHIKVSTNLLNNKRNVFAIRAVGASMNKANINGKSIEDGDLVIVDPTDRNIKSNDYVLSVIDDVANIKRILIDRENEQITLISESNSFYPPIYLSANEISKFLVNGKIVQVIKQ
jgi:repressor LexA